MCRDERCETQGAAANGRAPLVLMRSAPAGAPDWLAKIAAGGVALAVAETTVAKMRVFRVPNFLGAALMLGLLGVLLLFVSRGM